MVSNALSVLFCILVWLWGLSMVLKARRNFLSISLWRSIFAIISIAIICVCAYYDTDFYHYEDIFQSVTSTNISHMEDVYLPIALFANGNYLLFRFCIWGVAVLLAMYIAKRLKLPLSLFSLYFLVLILLKFGYGRVSLALTIATLGFTFIIKPISPKIFSILFGVLAVYVSSYFHDSVIFYIIILVISLLFINTGRKSLVILFVLYPVLVYLFQMYGGYYIMQYIDSNDSAQGALYYVNGDFEGYQGIGVAVKTFLERMPFFLTVLLAVLIRWNNYHNTMPFYMKIINSLSILTVITAFMFSFNTTINTYSLYYRFLYFAMLPMIILVTYCHMNRLFPKLINIIFWCGVIASSYSLIYSLYCNIVG